VTPTPEQALVAASVPRPPLLQRLAALALAFGVYLIGLRVITPALAQLCEPRFPTAPGPHLFLQHLLSFSLPTAAICLSTWWALARAGLLLPPSPWLGAGARPGRALAWGALVGGGLSLLAVAVGVAAGQRVRLHPDGWQMAGNLFSNYYEELTYRGLLLQAAWTATGSRVGAVVIAAGIFGWSHGHGSQAVMRMAAAAVAGLVFGLLAMRTRSLGAAWSAHQVSDMILDSL
jgi:membrane protease YdiL (CAAX protease family)